MFDVSDVKCADVCEELDAGYCFACKIFFGACLLSCDRFGDLMLVDFLLPKAAPVGNK